MKKLTGLFLALLMLFTPAVVSASISVPERTSNTTWVEDYADVLTPSTEKYIQEYSQKLADDHSACIVVVTMDYVTGEIDDYALSLFNQWKIGDGTFNNGVLLLLSIGDDDYYMMIGRGLEDSFPIYDIQELLDDYLEPHFAAKDYDAGVRSVFEHTYDYMENNIYYQGGGGSSDPYNEGSSFFSGLLVIICMIVCFIIIISVLRSVHRVRRYYEPTYYYTRPRHTTYYSPYAYRPFTTHYYSGGGSSSSSHSYSGGGGYSGHSSLSHSSGGSFHSGGGTSFGGSSRGAGAGRH